MFTKSSSQITDRYVRRRCKRLRRSKISRRRYLPLLSRSLNRRSLHLPNLKHRMRPNPLKRRPMRNDHFILILQIHHSLRPNLILLRNTLLLCGCKPRRLLIRIHRYGCVDSALALFSVDWSLPHPK